MQLSERFEQALVYAARLHARQRRKVSGTPYVAHLLAVAAIVLEHGGSEDEAIAALLHDSVEDQGGAETRQEICQRFGEAVARIVDACSDTDVTPKPPWHERKRSHLERMRDARASVRLVVAADKLHNLRSLVRDYRRLGDAVWQFFTAGKEQTLWYYREMIEALATAEPTPLVEEYQATLGELEALVKRSPCQNRGGASQSCG
jgi:(p)ppGpp synthase/HD superfamily hydrolase